MTMSRGRQAISKTIRLTSITNIEYGASAIWRRRVAPIRNSLFSTSIRRQSNNNHVDNFHSEGNLETKIQNESEVNEDHSTLKSSTSQLSDVNENTGENLVYVPPEEPLPSNDRSEVNTQPVQTTKRRTATLGRSRRLKKYKPNIPSSFIQSHFTPAMENKLRQESLRYGIDENIFQEALLCIRGGLTAESHRPRAAPAIIEALSTRKRHVLLDCPVEGSSDYINSVVHAISGDSGADLLSFDGQDIMELTEELWHQNHAAETSSRIQAEDLGATPPPFPFPYEQKTPIGIDQPSLGRLDVSEAESVEAESDGEEFGGVAVEIPDNWQNQSGTYYRRRHGVLRRLDTEESSAAPGDSKVKELEASILEKLVVFFSVLIDARPPNKVANASADATTTSKLMSIRPCIVYFRDVSDFFETDRYLANLLLSALITSINYRHVTRPTILVASCTPSVLMSPLSSAASAITKIDSKSNNSSGMRVYLERLFRTPLSPRDQKTADQMATSKREWDHLHAIEFMSELETGGVGDRLQLKGDWKAQQSREKPQAKRMDSRLGLTTLRSVFVAAENQEDDKIKKRNDPLPPGIAILPGHPELILDRFVRIGLTPPAWYKEEDKVEETTNVLTYFDTMRQKQIRDINTRSLLRVLQRKGISADFNEPLDFIENFHTRVWSFERLNRLATIAVGIYSIRAIPHGRSADGLEPKGSSEVDPPKPSNKSSKLTEQDIANAAQILGHNAKSRRSWAIDKLLSIEDSANVNSSTVFKFDRAVSNSNNEEHEDTQGEPERRHKRIVLSKDDLDQHESKLLSRVVDADTIQTTFDNVQVPKSVVRTLRSVITLPLLKPEDFAYGVLKSHFISGVLLFGPPGTGKTLLAKAVAKESGARMIEIKASDVFDMYVGEGEKNVQAVFSLARKLSPCVVFLDEVDALFGARRSDMANQNHREIINQFMLEWDGLSSNNSGVLLMGATNRPFDLDDAILRRMPRRILIDLPNEKDRVEILKQHLHGEKLAEDVNLEELSTKTNFFSGSDLKNLCVSAALDAVREGIDEIVGDISSINNARPEGSHRILSRKHFETAMKEITPSCSENMSSLTELRKWDSLYGDGGSERRRKFGGMGFGQVHQEPVKVPITNTSTSTTAIK